MVAVCALAGALASCKRERPNANHDLQKNENQYMNKMDAISKQMEAEERAKKEKEGTASPAAPAEKTPGEAPAGEPKKPEDTKPGGGK